MALFNITLISSFHKIHGECNPKVLYNIIEKIQPDIIFEELSNEVFDIIYSPYFQPETIEAITIKKYLQQYPIKHFPVDNYPINETDLLSDAQIIWEYSSEYRDLWNKKLRRLNESGYYFLNSYECTDMLNKLATIEETVLSETNNLKLLNEHKREKEIHSIREFEMLRTIYNIASQFPFDNAIFISGAEHRQRIKQKIEDFHANGNLKLKWTYFNEQ